MFDTEAVITRTMRDYPDSERPYERCLAYGTAVLSDAELLAVILRTGRRGKTALEMARELLSSREGGGGICGLMKKSVRELSAVRGIGRVKAVQILCAGELARRMIKEQTRSGVVLSHADSVAAYYMEDLRHKEREEICLACFDTRNRLLSSICLSRGTVNASLITPREVFIEALRAGAVSVILVHNHPSGDPAPSDEDVLLTRRIREAGTVVGIPVMDHIVIGDNCYCSLKECGYI